MPRPAQPIYILVLSLLTLLSEAEGLVRLAVPGARRPKSSLAAAVPLTLLRLQAGGRGDLKRVRQLQVLHSHGALGERLETLAAAQGLMELGLRLVPGPSPVPGLLTNLLLQLRRLEAVVRERQERAEALAISVQGARAPDGFTAVAVEAVAGGVVHVLGVHNQSLRPKRLQHFSA
jgi:hypothetical protein